MSATGKRILRPTIVAVLVCVLIGLYVGLYLVNVPGSSAAVQTSSGPQLYLGTVPASEVNDPHSTWVSYYAVDARRRQLAAHDDVHAAGEHARARDDLQLRQRLGAAQPVHQPGHRNGRRHDASTASRRRRSTPTPPRTSSRSRRSACRFRSRGSRTTQRTRAATHRAPVVRPHDDLVHVPHAGQGAVPLAVLRAVRGWIHRRVRRPDADRRLHGRLPQGRMSEPVGAEHERNAPFPQRRRCCGCWRT